MRTRIFNSDAYKNIFANIIGNSLKQPTKCPSVVKQIHKLCECVSVSRAATIFFFILIHFIVYTIVTCEFTELFPWQTRQRPVTQGKTSEGFHEAWGDKSHSNKHKSGCSSLRVWCQSVWVRRNKEFPAVAGLCVLAWDHCCFLRGIS